MKAIQILTVDLPDELCSMTYCLWQNSYIRPLFRTDGHINVIYFFCLLVSIISEHCRRETDEPRAHVRVCAHTHNT